LISKTKKRKFDWFFFQFVTLWDWLPVRFSLSQPVLVFTTQEHGFRLKTLLEKIDEIEYSILIIKTTNGEVIFPKKKIYSLFSSFSNRYSVHFVLVFGLIVIIKHILVLVNHIYLHFYPNN